MRQLISKPFPYFVGVYSLEELVTKESKVCVINILGTESRKVTPVSHQYSGANVVAGVQYGRRGELETEIGSIPVFRSVRDAVLSGVKFDIGVIYLPPTAVSQAVSELVTFNTELKRIVIVSEKIPSKDSMLIRFLCQEAGIDVIGANSLGLANVWDQVRVGGALGGDHPEETLRKGSIAIHSNSGNFTTTISEYLRTEGFGISTAISSGKDVYIHFALPEFLFAAQNDPRTKAIALYVEPGGYYEKQALDLINERVFAFNKPIVVCVTGRWKKDLNRAVGHAGALAGGGDDAESKEKWFDEYFEVDVFNPENPFVSKKGVRVASIQDFPLAMKSVFEKIDEKPDFEKTGDLSLKLWVSDKIMELPKELKLDEVKAIHPYDKQIKEINKHVGAQYLRQNMRNKSAASKMDKETFLASLYDKSVLELTQYSMEELIYFSLAKIMPEKSDTSSINLLLNILLKVDKERLEFLELAKRNNCSPNAYLASQIAVIGNNDYMKETTAWSKEIIDLIKEFDIDENTTIYPKELKDIIITKHLTDKIQNQNELTEILLKEIKNSSKKCESLQLCQYIIRVADENKMEIENKFEFLLAAISICIFWKPMLEKRITRDTAETALNYFYVIANLVAFCVVDKDSNEYWDKMVHGKPSNLTASFTENTFKILFNRIPNEIELQELKYLIGLTITNGPGTISAKGAKESVSARNHIPTAFVGFLANTGFAHGGNGFEAVEYLMDIFKDSDLDNPGNKEHELNIKEIANKAAKIYRDFKKDEKETGKMNYKRIPCINHPIFKGQDVNIDPREDYVKKEMEKNNIYNVFLDFYHQLVLELFNEGATRNVFCVNVDAVLAVIALKLVWNDLKKKSISVDQVQELVFILFLIGRTIGVAAEIADHRDRGMDMDCRTPQSEIKFVM